MKAVLHVGAACAWSQALGRIPWPLLPVGNRPLLEYWFEACVDLGIAEVRLILGEGADQVEAYVEEGRRWGLKISYGFLRDESRPLAFLLRSPQQWDEGVLFVSGPIFPRRLAVASLVTPEGGGVFFHQVPVPGKGLCALCRDPALLPALVALDLDPSCRRPFSELGLDPVAVETPRDYFAVNMQLAEGEMARYLAPGYGATDGSLVGYNVIIPPSARVVSSVILGNDTRIGTLASVGPRAVVGNRVVVDRQAHLEECIVLDDTYIGAQVEITRKIVAGNCIMDPADGEVLRLEDSWLVAGLGSNLRLGDLVRGVLGWFGALVLLAVQLPLFLLLFPLVVLLGRGRMERRSFHGRRGVVVACVFRRAEPARPSFLVDSFMALGLDLVPRVAGVLWGRWWLCGHEPLRAPEDNLLREELAAYFPAAISAATARGGAGNGALDRIEARHYVHARGVREDFRLARGAVKGRMVASMGDEGGDGEHLGDRG